jgi:crossover junction endodeoxyribonuclease RuvC
MACSGWALVQRDGEKITLIQNGTVETVLDKKDPTNSGRLEFIFEAFSSVIRDAIKQYTRIDAIVIERFFSKNYQGTLAVAEVRGIIKLLSSIYMIPIYEYAPQSVRKKLIGNGRAEKEDVVAYLRTKLDLEQDITLDETDAIAQGIYATGEIGDRTTTTSTATETIETRNSGKKRGKKK